MTAAMRTYLDSSYAAEMADLDRRRADLVMFADHLEQSRTKLLDEIAAIDARLARMKGELN